MDAIINLLVVMTVLSVVAERLTNYLKLRQLDPKPEKLTPAQKKDRDYALTWRSIMCGVAVAVFVKADFFVIINTLDEPFKTLGWVYNDNYRWVRSAATTNLGGFVYAVIGCTVTGVGLGFGSKFWHDILGAVYEVRDIARNKAKPPVKEVKDA